MIDFSKIYTDFASWIAVTVGGGVVGWAVALRRKVNTNEKQLEQDRAAHKAQYELIIAELQNREKQRNEDRERMERVEGDVREANRGISELKTAIIGKGS